MRLNPYCAGCGVAGREVLPEGKIIFVLILIVLDVGLLALFQKLKN